MAETHALKEVSTVLDLRAVQRTIDGVEVLRDIHWRVEPQQHWVVLGPNGSGKTTLMQIASMWLHPSAGEVTVLGQRLGHTDVRTLRSRIGFSSAALAKMLRPQLLVSDVVMTALNAALEPWWHEYRDEDHANAQRVLDRVGAGHLSQRRFGACSDGERQRVLVARSLMTDPGLILLDEPTAALDLAGREQFILMLNDLASDPANPPMVLVTHHVEEIPDRFSHCLLLRDGRTLAQGTLSLNPPIGLWSARGGRVGGGSGSGGGFHAGFGVLGRAGSGLGLGWVGGVGVCAGGAGPRGGRLYEQGQVV